MHRLITSGWARNCVFATLTVSGVNTPTCAVQPALKARKVIAVQRVHKVWLVSAEQLDQEV